MSRNKCNFMLTRNIINNILIYKHLHVSIYSSLILVLGDYKRV